MEKLIQNEIDSIVEDARAVAPEGVEIDDIRESEQDGLLSWGEEGIWVRAWVFVPAQGNKEDLDEEDNSREHRR